MWRHIPWLLALILCPIFSGGVDPAGQALVMFGLGLSLFLSASRTHLFEGFDKKDKLILALLFFVVIFSLIPIPSGAISIFQPARTKLPVILSVFSTLSMSVPGTVSRAMILLTGIALFLIARIMGLTRENRVVILFFLLLGILLMVTSEVVRMSPLSHLSLKSFFPHYDTSAGTYASRNHYSNWMLMAEFCALGICASNLRSKGKRTPFHEFQSIALCGAIILLGIGVSLQTGSRGGAMALVVGVGLFLYFVGKVIRTRAVIGVIIVTIVLLTVVILCSGRALDRTVGGDLGYKWKIWQDTVGYFSHFPVFGTGVGTYRIVSNIFKSFQGTQTFLHAENDYLEWMVETGLIGFLLLGLFLFRFLSRSRLLLSKSSVLSLSGLGVFVALCAFLFHSAFEFNLYIPANFFLFCVLLGFHFSPRSANSPHPRQSSTGLQQNWFNRLAALCFVGLAVTVGCSTFYWRKGRSQTSYASVVGDLKKSNLAWPLDTSHQMALARASVIVETNLAPGVFPDSASGILARTVAMDPYNWEPRFDLLWLELTLKPQTAVMVKKGWEVMKLNPLQPEIPLRIAEALSQSDKEEAIHFLHAFPPEENPSLIYALRVALQIDPTGSLLWSVVPNTDEGFSKLGDFGANQHLNRLATQAFLRIGTAYPPLVKAKKLLELSAAPEALQVLSTVQPGPAAEALLAKAHYLNGDWIDAISHAKKSWESVLEPASPRKAKAFTVIERTAIEIAKQPSDEKQIKELQSLLARNPGSSMIRLVLFDCLRKQDRTEEAAKVAVELASLLH
jgi:O-antigen ligase